jgi:head-tail adaptor
MEAARLRDRVAVEKEARVANGQGGFVTAWRAVPGADSIPAEVVAMSGDEALRLSVERATQQYRVRVRRRGSLDLTEKNRLKWKSSRGEVMAIKSVLPDPREPRAFLVLITEVGTAGS